MQSEFSIFKENSTARLVEHPELVETLNVLQMNRNKVLKLFTENAFGQGYDKVEFNCKLD